MNSKQIRKDDAWGVLGLQVNASQNEIKSAYRRMAIATHPDKNLGDPGS